MEDENDVQAVGISNKMQLETELTSKFLSGQMSFAEYSSEWYSGEDEDEHENEVNVTKNEEPLQTVPTERRRRRLTRLTPALVGLMGEANLRFVRGDVEMAEKMCHEIIKQLPTASEPYQTLAQIYEHDVEKSLQFSLLAAHLSPTDSNEWLRLAAISNQKNDLKQEMICYTQAIKADPHNFDIHMKRLDLLSKLEEMKYPLNTWIIARVKCYHKIVTCLPPTQGKIILKYARLATTLYHNGNEKEKACAVMLAAYNKCPTLFTLEDLNIFLELLISQKEFQKCLEVFVASVGVDIEAEIQTIRKSSNEIEEQTNYIKCAIPNDLAIDLKCKLLVSFIHLGAIDLVQTLLNDFLTNDVEKAGDLYMDIEEAFSAVGYHEMAMKVLEPLVKTPNFDLGAVWLKYADCLLNLGRQEEAVSAFYKVLKHAPQHPEARRKLFHILEKKEQIEDAINVLQQDYKYVVSPTLLYEQCKVLKKYNMTAKYLEAAESLLCRSVTKYRHEEELKIACKQKAGVEQIHEFRTIRGENPFHENDLHFEDENFKMTPVEEWDLFKELLLISFNLKQYTTMQRLCYSALIIKSLQSHKREIEFYALQACLLSKDYVHAFRFIRDIAQRSTTNRTWNLLSLVLHSLEDMTHTKYVTRLFQKEERWVKNLFLGNNYLLSGRYLVALKYFLEYHEQFREPISSFLISITILSMAAQKTFDKHHNLILQSVSYMLTYKQLRKCDQEVYYNLGRLYQMLNINNLAIEYYEKALTCKPIAVCNTHGNINLKMETAYNLYILYKDHSPDMARKTMLQHLGYILNMLIPANNVLFGDFCTILDCLNKKKKNRHEQDRILINFVNEFRINSGKLISNKNATFFPILRLLLPDKDRERNPYNLKETKLGALLVKVLSLNKRSHDAQELLNFRSVQNNFHDSDFAGIAFLVLKNRIPQKIGHLTIGDVNALLDKIATIVENKGHILDEAFSYAIKKLTAEQLKWFLRIILKDLKLGMGGRRIMAAFHPDAPELYESCSNLNKVCEDLGDGDTRPIELGVQVFFAVSPMLSERLDVTRIAQLLASDKLYQVEDKFDGERFQMHMENGIFEYFSRKGFTYSNNYGKTYDSNGLLTPLLKECFIPSASSFIIDGEMMGWHKEYQCFGSKGMAFDVKKITDNSRFRPCFCVFDILYYNGMTLIGPADKGGKTLKERLEILDSLFMDIPGVIMHSKREIVKDSVDVLNALNKAIENQDEGIVVKDLNSYYIANRRNVGWYKVKPEYTEGTMTDLDLVVIGADEAENKRQGRAKSFHVACLDRSGEEQRWVSVGLVASGLTFEEREKLCVLLEQHWKPTKKVPPPSSLYFNKLKPDLWIMPEVSIVLEVRATELVRSSSSGTDYTLRFPRVMKIRGDKPVKDVLTLEEFQKLVAERNAVVKLSTKRISENQIDEVVIKARKTRTQKIIQVAEKFRTKPIDGVNVVSKALDGREICILSDDEDFKKIDLIKIVESHGGKHVENPGPKTWCCIVGTLTFRVRKLIETEKFDIISTSWLRTLPESEEPCSLSPLDMLSIKHLTRTKLSPDYDEFGDNYRDQITEETLLKCLKKMDNLDPIYLTASEMLYIDEQLFGEHNPFSFLRKCTLHFVEYSIHSTLAKIYGATICDINENPTHIVIRRGKRYELGHLSSKIVYEDWLDKCFKEKKFITESEFIFK